MKKKQDIIQQYKSFREQVLNAREEDKRERTLTKEKQLQECIELQVSFGRDSVGSFYCRVVVYHMMEFI